MGTKKGGFDPRRYARSQEVRMVAGFFAITIVLGGAGIWYFYGFQPAVLGVTCILGGLLAFLLLYGLVSLIGRWANRQFEE
jgi:hypothetical protein